MQKDFRTVDVRFSSCTCDGSKTTTTRFFMTQYSMLQSSSRYKKTL